MRPRQTPERGALLYTTLSRLAEGIARGTALAGGLVLLGLVLATCLSIAGRALFQMGLCCGPIRGIYDYTEIAVAGAVFAFLPLCQLRRAHAAVDLFKPAFPGALNRGLDLVIDLAMLGVAVLITQRLWLGMLDKQRYGETTLIAQVPVWQGYALGLVGAIAFCLVAAFCVIRSGRALVQRTDAA